MLKWLRSPIVWGVLFIVAGLLFMLEAISGIQFGSIFWAALFFLGAVFFFNFYATNRANWWALIPSIIFLGICLSTLVNAFFGDAADFISGALVLGGIGASLVVVYLVDRRQWWAVIPAGVMFTLTVIDIVEQFVSELATAGLMFFGIGLTFAVLAMLPSQKPRMNWAWIPAGVLVVVGMLVAGFSEDLLIYVLPLILIVVGLIMIVRTFVKRK